MPPVGTNETSRNGPARAFRDAAHRLGGEELHRFGPGTYGGVDLGGGGCTGEDRHARGAAEGDDVVVRRGRDDEPRAGLDDQLGSFGRHDRAGTDERLGVRATKPADRLDARVRPERDLRDGTSARRQRVEERRRVVGVTELDDGHDSDLGEGARDAHR